MFVLEYAVQHQELLAATMHVRGEPAVRGVADDRGRARHLITDPVEHSPLHPRNGRRCPVKSGCMDYRASTEV
jgi:hypothetical protein